jgi:chromosome segregation ATPase
MSYEPRTRGMRSRRGATKKQALKEKRTSQENAFPYQEVIPVDQHEVSSRITNALEHLGNQRFALPPFYEHFQRWIKDVESVLADFEHSIPEAADTQYEATISTLMSNMRNELTKRIDGEMTLSSQVTELQKQLSTYDIEISELEKEQRNRTNEAKRGYERSIDKIRGEIDALDAQRLKLLRKKPSVLDRILARSRVKIEGSSHSLQSKRSAIHGKQEKLKEQLDGLRSNYQEKKREVSMREDELRQQLAKLKDSTLDDGLEIRKNVCEQIRRAVEASLDRLTQQTYENPKEDSPTSGNMDDRAAR